MEILKASIMSSSRCYGPLDRHLMTSQKMMLQYFVALPSFRMVWLNDQVASLLHDDVLDDSATR